MIGRFSTILWDVDGTLVNFEASEEISLKKAAALQGAEVSDEEIEIYKGINRKYWVMFEAGEVTKEFLYPARFRDWFEVIGLKGMDCDKMNEDYQVMLGQNPVLYEGAIELLKELSPSCRQYVVTNGSIVAQENKLEITGINKLMDGIFISEKMGVPKPEKAYFEKCAERIEGYNPRSTVIIGDSLTSDMQGGNNAGIACIWFNPSGLDNHKGLRIEGEVKTLQEIPEVLKRI